MNSPSVDALAMQALAPEVGHSFLDVGSGSGYLTMLASHMVAYSGNAVGVDVSHCLVSFEFSPSPTFPSSPCWRRTRWPTSVLWAKT